MSTKTEILRVFCAEAAAAGEVAEEEEEREEEEEVIEGEAAGDEIEAV